MWTRKFRAHDAYVSARYPSSLDEFYRARLPGTFDESKAGRRMKLPIPETWETQVALKGNNANTWQDLIGNFFLFGVYNQFCCDTNIVLKLCDLHVRILQFGEIFSFQMTPSLFISMS